MSQQPAREGGLGGSGFCALSRATAIMQGVSFLMPCGFGKVRDQAGGTFSKQIRDKMKDRFR